MTDAVNGWIVKDSNYCSYEQIHKTFFNFHRHIYYGYSPMGFRDMGCSRPTYMELYSGGAGIHYNILVSSSLDYFYDLYHNQKRRAMKSKKGITAKFAKGTKLAAGQVSYTKDYMKYPNVELLERCEYEDGTGYAVIKVYYPKSE